MSQITTDKPNPDKPEETKDFTTEHTENTENTEFKKDFLSDLSGLCGKYSCFLPALVGWARVQAFHFLGTKICLHRTQVRVWKKLFW